MRSSQPASTQRGHAPTRIVADTKVGVWRVIEHVGLARQRSSYSVTQIDSGAVGLLEVYDAPPRKFGSYVERLRAVMHQVNRIKHPGICAILDVGTLDDGRPYVVRTNVQGEPLGTRIRRRVLSSKQSLSILLAICDALRAAHACNVVHGALEPEHVMVCDGATGSTIKLLDWGICDEVRRAAAPGAMIVRIPPTRADDVHALGVMMHALFERIPPQLERIWTAMLVDNPSARPSLADVESELAAVDPAALHAHPTRQPTPSPVSVRVSATPAVVVRPAPAIDKPAAGVDMLPNPGRPSRRGAWLVSLGVGVAGLVACALYVALPDSSTARASTSLVQARPESTQPRSRTVAPGTPAAATAHATPMPLTDQPTLPPAAAVMSPPLPVVDEPQPPTVAAVVSPPLFVVDEPQMSTVPAALEPAAGRATPSPEPTPAGTASVRGNPITPVLAVAHRPTPVVRPAASSPMPDVDRNGSAEVIAQHERVGRQLLEIHRQFGPAVGADVAERFRWIKLDMALATRTSRRLLSMTLTDLGRRLEAARASACAKAPDAALCRA